MLRLLLCALVSTLLLTLASLAQTPNFDYPCLLVNGDGYLVADNICSVPCLQDWDGDGDADLMVGVMYDGYVYYYENVSPGSVPQFGPRRLVMAEGDTLSVSYA
ncbi:MAG: hypothetical protein C4524_14705 [Candidatus Zixiibacteriota bacterium]|nr:MAG: hypothetical protein C4524_14705 [candidate division Zixibacteria bacterium]